MFLVVERPCVGGALTALQQLKKLQQRYALKAWLKEELRLHHRKV